MRLQPSLHASALLVGLTAVLLAGCGSGGAGGGTRSGVEVPKPGGGTFFVDPNQGGRATSLRLAEVLWGRLVDVHDVDERGLPSPEPVFRDFVIDENVQSDALDYELETNPITQQERLVVLRRRGDDPLRGSTFESLLSAASRTLAPIVPRNDDGTDPGPFSFAPRNGCLVLRFDDCLDDSPRAARELPETVRLVLGGPGGVPFSARAFFDPNHGALVGGGGAGGGAFHSTRVLVDLTVSQLEAEVAPTFLPLNTLGLPPSEEGSGGPSASVRIPTRLDPLGGQVQLLRGLGGATLAASGNGPVDTTAPTLPVVRAFRGGNGADANNGFLLDFQAPELVGEWPVVIETARADPNGVVGFDFLADVRFSGPCVDVLRSGDTFAIGAALLEVRAASRRPVAGQVAGVEVRWLATAPLLDPNLVVGAGSVLKTFDARSGVDGGCWLSFSPMAASPPSTSVSSSARVSVRFSKPMDPSTVTPFDTFMMLRGSTSQVSIDAEDVIAGNTSATSDLMRFTFVPLQPHTRRAGQPDPLRIVLGDVTDLAGNPLAGVLPPVEVTLDPNEPEVRNGSVALRFSSVDELAPRDVELGVFDDLVGQVTYDFDRGRIVPRRVAYESHPVDRTNPVPAIMVPFVRGIQTPLSALGSKLQMVWRYADLGWGVLDATKFNLDVYGLAWSPIGGVVVRDRFEQFEIRLAHSRHLPDEELNTAVRIPRWQFSGLEGAPETFADNVLPDTRSPQMIVHPRALGYDITPTDLFLASTGTPLVPWPLNRTANRPLETFTWRDTSVEALGGRQGAGVPMGIESGPPVAVYPAGSRGTIWRVAELPSIALPLLIEFRCYPSAGALGLNPLDISLAINSSASPNFRVFSTGGTDTSGRTVLVEPDFEDVPAGGFNPRSRPAGKPTIRDGDNALYIGQLDTVVRVSRAVTVWIDTQYAAPRYLDPILVPDPSEQPPGTRVLLESRGAHGFGVGVGTRAFDAASLDPYGEVLERTAVPPVRLDVSFLGGASRWESDLSVLDGARYFQLRFTFVNDLASGRNAELSAVGVAFAE